MSEIGDFSRFQSAAELMAFVGLVPSEHSSGEKRRQGSITKVGNSHVRRLLVEAAWHARRRPKVGYELARRANAAKTPPWSSDPGAASSASTSAGSGWPAAANRSRRSSSPARASSPASSGRSRPSNHSAAPEPKPLDLEQRMRPTTRRTLETSMRHRPVTCDARPRQLPTVPSHAVPTGECQSDPPSLPRPIRCSRPRPTPSTRAGPLDLLLHVRGLM
ncbi:MAG: IS110 family transposase [Actinomycetota bacterium]|nr:IS110 family transposase [Actinomycetota bacterium]